MIATRDVFAETNPAFCGVNDRHKPATTESA